jgi:transposase
MHNYPSDITREQFKLIRNELEAAKKKTKPRTVDLYDVFRAILYLIKSDCQWRMLPAEFPNWNTVYMYFRIWSEKKDGQASILERVLKKL